MPLSDSDAIVGTATAIAVGLAVIGLGLVAVGLRPSRPEKEDYIRETHSRRLSLLGSLGTSLMIGAAFSLLVSMLGRQLDAIATAEEQMRQQAAIDEEQLRVEREKRDQILSTYLNALLFSSNLGGLDFARLDQQLHDAGVDVGEFAESLTADEGVDDCRELPPSLRKSQLLRGIKLAGKNLDYANFSGLELKNVDLRHASLREATFCKVNLTA